MIFQPPPAFGPVQALGFPGQAGALRFAGEKVSLSSTLAKRTPTPMGSGLRPLRHGLGPSQSG